MKDAEAARELTYAILSAGNSLIREAGRLFKPHGITAVQFNVLSLLLDAQVGLRPSELTTALVVDASSTTYVVDRMEELGWLKRVDDNSDRRAWHIVLTPAGRKLHAEVSPIYAAAMKKMLHGVAPGHVPLVCEVLKRIPGAARNAVDASLEQGGNKHTQSRSKR